MPVSVVCNAVNSWIQSSWRIADSNIQMRQA
jgi:hypothetical protein